MGQITAEQVMPLVLEAMPSFRARWPEVEAEHADEAGPGGRLGYLDASEVARHAVARLAAGDRAEVAALLDVVERLHVEGDGYVAELATIGYLEDIQTAAERHPVVRPADFLPFLGPVSAKWWRAVERFWNGAAPAVRIDDLD